MAIPPLTVLPQDATSDDRSENTEINQLRKMDVNVISEKVYLRLFFSETPQFEIIENLKNNILTLKLRDTKFYRKKQDVQFFNEFLRRASVERITDDETWIIITTLTNLLKYDVLPNPDNRPELNIVFELTETPAPSLVEDNSVLNFTNHEKTENGERITLELSKEVKPKYVINTLPSFSVDFFLPETRITENSQLKTVFSELIRPLELIETNDGVQFSLHAVNDFLDVDISYRGNPYRIIIDFKKIPPDENISSEEALRYVNENTEDPNESYLRNLYLRAEFDYRRKKWDQAAKQFKSVHIASPESEIGIRALFRSADAYHQKNLAEATGKDFDFVVQEYGFAITYAERANLSFPELERAYFNIGVNYQKGKFYDLAEEYYREVIRRFPKSVFSKDSQFQIGILHNQTKDYEKSIYEFAKFIEENPNSKNTNAAYYYLGINHYLKGDFKKAKFYFDRARNRDITLFSHDPDFLFAQAETYFENDELEKARSIYELILDSFLNYPKRTYIIIRLGDYHRDTGQEKSALETYELGINDENTSFAIISRMRIANMIAYHPSPSIHNRAIELYRLIIDEFPETSEAEEAKLLLAITYSIHDRFNESVKTFDEFREQYPKSEYRKQKSLDKLFVRNLVKLMIADYEKDLFNSVVKTYNNHRKILDEHPLSPPYLKIAQSYLRIGDLNQANIALNRAISIFPKDRVPLAGYLLAKNYFDNKNYREAINVINRYIDAHPENYYTALSHILIGNAYSKLNLTPEAINVFETFLNNMALNVDPIYFDFVTEAWFELGEIYKELGKYSLALNSYKKCIESYKHSMQSDDVFSSVQLSYFYIGDMNFELKQLNNSKRDYQRALGLYPNNERAPWAKYQTGHIYQKQGNTDQALRIYDELISEAGENPKQLWALFAIEARREIVLNQEYKDYLEDPNNEIGNGS